MRARIRSLLEARWQLLVAIGAAWFVLAHLHPGLILRDTTPTGGDTGLHIWSPDVLRSLLGRGRLSGWSPDWFAGFPAFRFYMVLPTLFVVALDLAVPQNVAFKLVAAAGPTMLPLAAYAFASGARLREPAPAMFAVATLPFLFDRYHTIWGGNIAATLAGEIGYSLSLVAAVGALGLVAHGLRSGRFRAGAAALSAVAVLCHPIAALFVAVGWAALLATAPDRAGAVRWSALPAVLAGAASAFWVVPFVVDRDLTVDLGWRPIDDVWGTLTRLESGPTSLRWELGAALVGVTAAVLRRHRTELALVVMAGGFAAAVALLPEGQLWNARLVPLWYLVVHFLAALGAVALLRGVVLGESVLRPPTTLTRAGTVDSRLAILVLTVGAVVAIVASEEAGSVVGAALLVMLAVEARASWIRHPRRSSLVWPATAVVGVVLLAVSLPLRSLPGGSTRADGSYHWGPFSTTDESFVPLWAAWNNAGYEARTGDDRGGGWDEYSALVAVMTDLGATHGCGRAMWEAGRDLERYGSPGALALLPHWTDGCIASMEGLFFESSASTPFHFVDQVELSEQPSPALSGIEYPGFDPTSGFDHLEVWGVRYYLAFSEPAVAAAAADRRLVEVAASGPWVIFELAEVDPVASLAVEPVVVVDVDRGSGWRDAALLSYSGAIDPRVPLVTGGPPEWTRVPADALSVGIGAVRIPTTTIDDVDVGDDRIAFSVAEIGHPVVVRTSWFPSWEVSGAEGPYRMAPNLMVVVPTSTRVELRFQQRPVDRASQVVSVAAIVAIAATGRARRPRPRCLAARTVAAG